MKKNLLRIVLLTLNLFLVSNVFSQEAHSLQTLESRVFLIPDSIISIDGIPDEPVWSKANEMVLSNYLQGENITPEDLSATAKVLWSDSALYVSMTVMDDSLTLWEVFKDSVGFDNKHGKVDAVDMHIEIPVNWDTPLGDPSTGDYSEGTFYIRHKVLTPNDWTGNARGSWAAIGYEVIEYKFARIEGGYTFEARYPFSLLFEHVNVKPEDLFTAERKIGMEIMLADADGAPTDSRLAWNQNNGYYAWQYKDAFGQLSLVNTPIDKLHTLQTLEVKAPYVADSKITIDGKASESIWKNAQEMVLSNYLQGTNITPEDLSATAKVLWSDSALYVSMTVKDDSLTLWNEFKDLPGFDNKHGKVDAVDMHIEIPVDWDTPLGDPSTGDYSEGTFYIRHKVLTPNDWTGNARGSWAAIGYEVIEYMFVRIEGGYTFEAKYPYSLLFANVNVKPEDLMTAERKIGMEIMIADADGVPTDTRLAWNQNNGYTAWQYKDAFGQVKLGNIPKHTLQTLEAKAPYVADNKMTIDGKADESIWSKAEEMVLSNYLQGANITPEDLSATAKVLWSDSALYVSMTVKDDSLTLWNDFKDLPGFDNKHGKVDAVDMHIEIPVDWNTPLGDPSTGDYSEGTFYIRHKVLTPNDWTGNARGSWAAIGYEVIEYMFVRTDDGYTFEAKYPYSLLFEHVNVKPEDLFTAERKIGMEIMLADADGVPTDTRLAWNQNYGYNSWQYKDAFGQVKLGSIPKHSLQTLEAKASFVEDKKMTVDGIANESGWSKAEEMVLSNYLQGTNITPEDLSATAKVLWSDSALYVSMTVMDDSLTLWNDFKDLPGFDNKHGKVDAVDMHIEIPVDWNTPLGDPSTGDYSEGTFYIRHKVLTPNDWTGNARGSWAAIGYEVIEYMFVRIEGGYTFEAKYPYSLLFEHVNVKPEDLMTAERKIGMEIMIADADGVPTDTRLAWNQNYGYTSWQYKDAFGQVKLGNIPKHTLQTLEAKAPYVEDDKITVDGIANESNWSGAEEMVLSNYLQGTNITPEDLSAAAKVLWSDSALYVSMTVKDDSLTLWNEFKDLPGFDNKHGKVDAVDMHIEIPIDWTTPLGDPSTGDYSEGTFYIRHKVLTPNDWTGNARGSWAAIGYEVIEYMFVRIEGGYTFEAKYPFSLLFEHVNVKPEDLMTAERKIGMEIMLADADGAPMDTRLAWNQNYGYNSWQYKDAFGQVLLSNSGTVGIRDIEDLNSLNVYPNPVHDKLNVHCNTNISKVYVSNVMGQTIWSKHDVNTQHLVLETNGFNPGIYMISVVDMDNKTHVRKVIVK